MTRRFDLTDGQWAVSEPLLPKARAAEDANESSRRANEISMRRPPRLEGRGEFWLLVPHQASFALLTGPDGSIFVVSDEFSRLPRSYVVNTMEAVAWDERDHPHHTVVTVGVRVTGQQKATEFYVGKLCQRRLNIEQVATGETEHLVG